MKKNRMKMNKIKVGGELNVLPEGCVANILWLTCPSDVARQSAVSSTFRSAAESDDVWERFLPSDYKSVVSQSSDPSLTTRCFSKKQLFLSLSETPILVDARKKSFWLDKHSGKKCLMLSARDLSIIWSDDPRYWNWITHPSTLFDEVAELNNVCWLDISGKISPDTLSPKTHYTSYLVFKRTSNFYGFNGLTIDSHVELVGSEGRLRTLSTRGVCIGQVRGDVEREQYPRMRQDGWLEIELGKFLNEGLECGELVMSFKQVRRLNWKGGLIVQGIQLRPTQNGH